MPAPVLTGPGTSGALPQLALPQVTLVAATSIAPVATARAIARSLAGIAFKEVLWASDLPPPAAIAGLVRWERIAPLDSRAAYSRFMVQRLAGLVQTGFALCVQWDGHVLDPGAWDNSFLEWDYIGAVWPQFAERTVGNGGFSLRSRRLLQACASLPEAGEEPEDLFICRTMAPLLEQAHGIRFAPPPVARRFAYERLASAGATFGYHGVFNLVAQVSDGEGARLVAELPHHALARGELRELLRWSLGRGRWRLATELARRWRRWI